MKVLLVSIDSKYIHSNLAVRSLKAYASRFDIDTEINTAEYTINQQVEKVLASLYGYDADVIMFSCYIWNRTFMGRLLDDLAVVRGDAEIWLGGPEVSFHSDKILKEFPNVRGIMKGEGEETFKQLLKAYDDRRSTVDDLKNIDGIIYRDNGGDTDKRAGGEIVCTPQREPLDMDELPFAYEELSDFQNRIIYYESSRGCPYRCSYCLSSVDKRLRFRSLDLVKKELKFFLDNKVRQVKFVDRTFNCDHRRTSEIWRFLRDNDNGVTNFHFEMAADILNAEEISLLAELRPGQVQLEIGVQTTNHDTLEAIDRPMDFTRLRENVSAIKKAGNVHLHLDLIAGLPYENMAGFEKSFNDVFELRPEQLQLGFLKVLKGSPMESSCREYGIRYRTQPPYEVLKTKWISYEELLELKLIEEMVEVYYNTGQFRKTLELLIGAFGKRCKGSGIRGSGGAFGLFRRLGRWYEREKLDMVNLSRNSRYELLFEFGKELLDGLDPSRSGAFFINEKVLLESIILDYYSRENVKTRPVFFGEETVSKEFAKEFYSAESREHRYLTSDELKECDDPRILRKHTHLEKTEKGYLLFDYTARDPLTNNAMITEIL